MTDKEKLIEAIHNAVLNEILKQLQSGEAPAALIAKAWDICKDNGIALEDLSKLKTETPLANELPFSDADESPVVGRIGKVA